MNEIHVYEVVAEVSRALPVEMAAALTGVDLRVWARPEDATAELDTVASDARGLYVGDFFDGEADEDEELRPCGVIHLFASNLTDKDEAFGVILHEIAHALGLGEAEVAELGL